MAYMPCFSISGGWISEYVENLTSIWEKYPETDTDIKNVSVGRIG